MTLDLGTLQASLKMDTSGFTSGISNAVGSLGGLTNNLNGLTKDLTAASAGIGTLKTAIAGLGKAMLALLANPVVLIAAAIAGLVALGKAAYDAYVEIDAAYDAIEIGTGAVGESLAGLQKSFDDVFANATYVESAETLAATIADLNTYLGVEGDQLESIATQISNIQGMGMDVSVDSLSKAFNRWGVEADDMSGYLDYFFQLSQQTGISIDTLSDNLSSSQAVLATFGFSLQESANLLAQMNKAGFETGELNTAFKQLTANGVTTKAGFEDLIGSIKNAATQQEALAIASENFGTRTKDSMVALIKSGAFDELGGAFEDSLGAVNDTAKSTEDFGDKMNRLGRGLTSFGAQAGAVINTVLSKVFDFFEWTSSIAAKIFAPFQKLFAKIGASFSKFWGESSDTTGDAIGNIMGFVEKLADGIAAGIDWFLEFVYPAIEVVIEQIVNVIKLFSAIFAGDWSEAFKLVGKIAVAGMTALYNIMELGWNAVMDGVQSALQWIVDRVFDGINMLVDGVENNVNTIINAINTLINQLNGLPFINIDTIGNVSWNVETPQIPQITRFEDSFLGQESQKNIGAMELVANGTISLSDLTGSGSQTQDKPQVTVNQYITTPVYDTSAAENAARRAQEAAYKNPGY